MTGARQATPTAGASESAQDHTECGLSVRTHNWGEPILLEILSIHQSRGERLFPSDWCKAGNAHRRCPRRAHKTIRSVVYLCTPHNWGEPILPEIQSIHQSRGKVISLLTGARQATPTAGARRAHKTIRSVVYLCAPHNWGEPILPGDIAYTSQEGKGYFPPLDWCKAGNAHRRCLGERTRPYGSGLSVRTP